MRERRAEVLVLLVALLLPLFFPALAYAEGVSTSATVLNAAPTLDNLDLSPDDDPESPGVQVITPDPSTNKTVTIIATVSDDNGWDDIATVTAAITGPGVIAESPLNLGFDSNSSITTARYKGSFNLSEHSEGAYTVTVTATDANGLNDSISADFTYCYRPVYALWANSTTQKRAIHWSGSKNEVTGRVHSNNDIRMSGSKNTISGTTEYVSNFINSGSKNVFSSPPVQVAPGPMPVHYTITDYAPGGSRAIAAAEEGKYHYINGNFQVSGSDVVLDGLYYVAGEAKLKGNRISGVFTIVAEEKIDVSSSGHNCTAYVSDLLFMSQSSTAKSGITMSVSEGTFNGNSYTKNGVIAVSGSKNTINGGLFGDTIKLSISESTITALVPESTASYPYTSPLGDNGIIEVIKALLHFFG